MGRCDNVAAVTTPTPAPRRFRWGTAVRAVAGVAIIAVVVTRVPLRDLAARFAQMRASDVAILVFLACLQMSTGVGRWWRLLSRVGERPPLSAVCRDLLVGALFNTFLPTSFGGDVVRAIRMSRRLEAPHRAWSTSLFERLVGLLTLALAGAVAALFVMGNALPSRQRVVIVCVALALGVAFFFASTPLRILVGVLEKRLPSAFIADVRGVVADLEGPLTKTALRLETFAWSLSGFLASVVYVLAGARALGAAEFGLAAVVGLPIVSVLSIAPVSLGGHGLREGLFVVVLGMLGVPKDVALGIALIALAYNIFFALLGGAVSLVEPTTRVKAVTQA